MDILDLSRSLAMAEDECTSGCSLPENEDKYRLPVFFN